MRIEISLVRVEITLVRVVIKFMSVRVYKSHSSVLSKLHTASGNCTLRVKIALERFVIVLVSIIITLIRVKIILVFVCKSHSGYKITL
jgi:hypothetical protein